MTKSETKKCKKCMEEINRKAKKCPKCGANLGLPGWLKFLIIIGIVFVMCISCMSSCANSVNDAIEETEKEYKDEYADINGKTSFKVSESFENKHLKITITEVDTNWKGYSSYTKPSSGKKVIRITLTAENVGAESDSISSYSFNCYADDVVVDEYIWADDYSEFGGTLSSGKKTIGAIYYEVPTDAETLVLEYEPNILDSESVITFELN